MTKRLVAKTGEYQNQQGEQKSEWTKIGIIGQGSDGGEYMLLDPAVSLSGILAKQNALAVKQGKEIRDNVMVSIFTDENQQQSNQQQWQGQQSAPQQSAPQQSAPQQFAQQYQQNQSGQSQYNGNNPPL